MVEARKKLEALAQMSGSEALRGVATLFKRVKTVYDTRGTSSLNPEQQRLTERRERLETDGGGGLHEEDAAEVLTFLALL